MPRESTLKLTPLPRAKESLGQRLARFRKERGYTQTELAAKIGLIQALISDYERDKLRMNSDHSAVCGSAGSEYGRTVAAG